MKKEIYIVRHGETEYNKQHIVQGSGVDSSLNDTGRAQATALFEGYKHIDFDLVYTSALIRTRETAKHFLDRDVEHIEDADINEICWGIYEGKGAKDKIPGMKDAYKILMAKWANEDYDAKIEEGESAREMGDRLSRFLEKVKTRKEEKILVVMHGRTIRCLMCLVEGRAIKFMDEYDHKNTGVYKIVQSDKGLEIVVSNNVDHLKELNLA